MAPPALWVLWVLWLRGVGAGDCAGRRRVLRGDSGFVTDGPGNYSVNGNCEWLLEAPSPRHRLLLTFTFMDTECTYDYLFVYDGGSPRAPLLASLSGSALPPPLEAASGKMLLHLFSDANYNLLGFNASFRASLCPGGCSGRGRCDSHGRCHCDPGWGGPACAHPPCPTACQPHGGACSQVSGRCECRPGFLGRACDLALGENRGGGRWYNVSEGDPDFTPRVAAAGAVLPHTGGFYVFGGLDLNRALGDLVVYNFTTNRWTQLELSPAPAPRHSHVALRWRQALVLMGGELAGGALAHDLWVLEPLEGGWRELHPPGPTRPPGLAAHAATIVDEDWLYVFGGRTAEDVFSSQLFRLRLPGGGWERVLPWGGKPPAAAGHSMVFHPSSRTLLVYGGHRPSTARFSVRSNTTDLFHVERRHWAALRGSGGPRERAFHSATVIGDYMVVYGGNVHTHYHEEKCYEEEIFFYHLGCHQWVPHARLPHGGGHGPAPPPPGPGRYAHVAGALGGSVLLVAGGFGGVPRGDLLAYKVPAFVLQVPPQNYHLDFCSLYAERGTCTQDPQCAWCSGGCQSPPPHSTCPGGCLGLARLLSDCESCLVFGGAGPGPPRAPGPLGWCVQNETCLPLTEQSRCRVGQIAGTHGWWGARPLFLTALAQCRSANFPPGLHLLTFQHPRNDSQPDKVSIVRSTTVTLGPSGDADVSLVYRGFIHPLLGPPPAPDPRVWARIQRLDVVARLGRFPNSPEMEEVGRWSVQQERETRPLQRPRPGRLFGAPERGNKYAVSVEGRARGGGGDSSELTLVWDRTGVPGGSEISFFFLEPSRAPPGRCPTLPSCLACLADLGCGWCPPSASCQPRLPPPGGEGGPCGGGATGGGPRLVLAPALCVHCEEHRDCRACAADPFCEWQEHGSKKGDAVCSRRGRQDGAVRDPQECPPLCSQRQSCSECLSGGGQCAWCQSSRRCFLFAAYLARFPYGGCRGWADSVHSAPQCPQCSQFSSCRECLRHLECGWCGDSDNPTRGRCLEGDFSGVRGFPNCSVALGALTPPAVAAAWAYAECPDVDECRLGLATCHPRARCRNTPGAFECRCRRGYAGDGVTHCNRTCYHDCGHGECSGAPDFTCVCHLGWTSVRGNGSVGGGNATTAPPDTDTDTDTDPTGPLCSIDCGCNFHSTCEHHGPGVCDSCQDWTEGERCERCRAGSFGDARAPGGCQPCQCHGHSRPERGHCHRDTGHCFCRPPAEGPHCERCAPGHIGDPRNGGLCYRACGGRHLVANLSSSLALSTRGGPGAGGSLSYCLWVLSVGGGPEPCPPGQPCPPISLTLQPDPHGPCTHSFAYAFDGAPALLHGGAIEGDPALLGAFCGGGRPRPLRLRATSGLLVLYVEANGTGGTGLNASVGVGDCGEEPGGPGCPPECPGGCRGPTQGECDQSLGQCRCWGGFLGPDCLEPPETEPLGWERLGGGQGDTDPPSGFLRRLGHSLVPGPEGTLWMFGGLAPDRGPLGSLHRYSIAEGRWRQMLAGAEDGGPGPAPRYFHAAAALPGRRALLVVGGMTRDGAASDAWLLNLTTLQWRPAQDPVLPPLAGHTLTPRRGLSLLLIGGFAPQAGFNQKLLEFGVNSERWETAPQAGTPPTGLYGHSAVYHAPSDAVFVFGGQRFLGGRLAPSPDLYSLHCPTHTWGLLAPARGDKPQPRFFHAAAALGDAMVVLGGRTEREALAEGALLYHLRCNAWLPPPPGWAGVPEPAVALAVAEAEGRVFVSGGFAGVALGQVLALQLPGDPCETLPPPACNRSGGVCTWCRGGCRDPHSAHRLGCSPEAACAPSPRGPPDCRRLRSCSECLALHPETLQQGTLGPPPCKWCTNCPEGACIGRAASCAQEHDCRINQREVFAPQNCSEAACGAPDCASCTAGGACMWTRQFKRTGETRRILSVQPSYDWSCFSHSLLNVSPMPVESSPPLPCPTPCHQLGSCPTCLGSKGADGGWQHCLWSVALQECLSPSVVPLRCVAGGCGRMLRAPESCTPGCAGASQCAQCLRQPRCGWCARKGGNGSGRCLEGGIGGPRHGLAQACGAEAEWAFVRCPPENECENGHHDCGASQECRDLPEGFTCACRPGYRPHNDSTSCRPVCERGCRNGTCVEPNRCRCHFGFVGPDCSVPCGCNGHGQCPGPAAREQCPRCLNNTQGPQCERCRPLFVGSARGGGTCRPCRSFCRHNADVCLRREERDRASADPQRFPLDPELIPTWVPEGPSEEAAVCVGCQNDSVGERCERCRPGFFLLDGVCTRCQCNGHAATCNEDGTGCPCQNNTESASCAGPDRRDCYRHQCSKCRDSFHGHPVGGQQCYRLMAVEQEYCLDPGSQSNCFHAPQRQPLPAGRTVLFGVQPKFTNVDIRITLDVTFGAVDLFVSTAYDTFAVDVEPGSGRHRVRLQSSANASRLREERADGLLTYLTVRQTPAAALVVRGVRDRLVLTYPHTRHPLKSTRFYLVVLGTGEGPAQGLLFFRQDQAHIDLFVFFSVFFSCFFLFLALCVLLWKAKQGLDARHEQRRHLQEMSKMASRPFATVTVCFERGPPAAPQRRRGRPPGIGAGPVTLEPTEDGVAAVATLLLQLPGGGLGGPPPRAALASALVTLRPAEGGGGVPRKGGHELTAMAL
ncbi:LOW QUALITY PROTEIN: multiple epidermal growth factor-like domains protein 8 [Cuculus canorus]|uniref:LOW QUALITY PROTEIN: multiple epidermal growth factor-like domains protein 8 n=1 Tax=Cuculus canorus TaxID=55661 RepID=UPI0023AB366F|nr:LOW QUALITY PROTEIN: multiple epidermal growth factor-like domains protein 8 [Cuculus canorus]